MAGAWAALYSGGKDSSWALYAALQRGLNVTRLVTVRPEGDSYIYHTPATRLTDLAAESLGLPLTVVDPGDLDAAAATDAGAQGDAELEPLRRTLASLAAGNGNENEDEDGNGNGNGNGDGGRSGPGLTGVTAGAVESAYQADRIGAMCERLGIDLYAPLWRRDPWAAADEMLTAGFEIRIVAVAARGLDESWLGRRFDRAALAELRELNATYGVHPLGEGGEFETIVTDGPHMGRPIELDYGTEWDGTRGRLVVRDARLG